jgi:hypothetical protein
LEEDDGYSEAVDRAPPEWNRPSPQRRKRISVSEASGVIWHPCRQGLALRNSASASFSSCSGLTGSGPKTNGDDPLLTDVSVIPKGQEIEERFFPLLFDPRVKGT